jgi:hypothetical protein
LCVAFVPSEYVTLRGGGVGSLVVSSMEVTPTPVAVARSVEV